MFYEIIGVSFTTVNRWENDKTQLNIKAMKIPKAILNISWIFI